VTGAASTRRKVRISVDDVHLRTASDAELSAAYDTGRACLPDPSRRQACGERRNTRENPICSGVQPAINSFIRGAWPPLTLMGCLQMMTAFHRALVTLV
jgi:hypothetical protein